VCLQVFKKLEDLFLLNIRIMAFSFHEICCSLLFFKRVVLYVPI
jgi:hypothetical protein